MSQPAPIFLGSAVMSVASEAASGRPYLAVGLGTDLLVVTQTDDPLLAWIIVDCAGSTPLLGVQGTLSIGSFGWPGTTTEGFQRGNYVLHKLDETHAVAILGRSSEVRADVYTVGSGWDSGTQLGTDNTDDPISAFTGSDGIALWMGASNHFTVLNLHWNGSSLELGDVSSVDSTTCEDLGEELVNRLDSVVMLSTRLSISTTSGTPYHFQVLSASPGWTCLAHSATDLLSTPSYALFDLTWADYSGGTVPGELNFYVDGAAGLTVTGGPGGVAGSSPGFSTPWPPPLGGDSVVLHVGHGSGPYDPVESMIEEMTVLISAVPLPLFSETALMLQMNWLIALDGTDGVLSAAPLGGGAYTFDSRQMVRCADRGIWWDQDTGLHSFGADRSDALVSNDEMLLWPFRPLDDSLRTGLCLLASHPALYEVEIAGSVLPGLPAAETFFDIYDMAPLALSAARFAVLDPFAGLTVTLYATALTSSVIPALRMNQRDDGLGPQGHARLNNGSANQPSSVQDSRSPRLPGTEANRYV